MILRLKDCHSWLILRLKDCNSWLILRLKDCHSWLILRLKDCHSWLILCLKDCHSWVILRLRDCHSWVILHLRDCHSWVWEGGNCCSWVILHARDSSSVILCLRDSSWVTLCPRDSSWVILHARYSYWVIYVLWTVRCAMLRHLTSSWTESRLSLLCGVHRNCSTQVERGVTPLPHVSEVLLIRELRVFSHHSLVGGEKHGSAQSTPRSISNYIPHRIPTRRSGGIKKDINKTAGILPRLVANMPGITPAVGVSLH